MGHAERSIHLVERRIRSILGRLAETDQRTCQTKQQCPMNVLHTGPVRFAKHSAPRKRLSIKRRRLRKPYLKILNRAGDEPPREGLSYRNHRLVTAVLRTSL